MVSTVNGGSIFRLRPLPNQIRVLDSTLELGYSQLNLWKLQLWIYHTNQFSPFRLLEEFELFRYFRPCTYLFCYSYFFCFVQSHAFGGSNSSRATLFLPLPPLLTHIYSEFRFPLYITHYTLLGSLFSFHEFRVIVLSAVAHMKNRSSGLSPFILAYLPLRVYTYYAYYDSNCPNIHSKDLNKFSIYPSSIFGEANSMNQ